MLKNLPRHYNPPGNGKRDMEKPIYADNTEIAMIKALFGPGQMTKHGIPSYSWRDDSGSDTNGTQDGSGGSMSGSGSVSGTGGGGFGGQGGVTTGGRGGYTFSGVPGTRNIGNWNTGGPAVGVGSQAGGIRGFAPPMQQPPRVSPTMSQPVQPIPPVVPPVQPPVQYPLPGTVTDVFGPNYQMDPGIINQMFQNTGINAPPSTFPARPGVSPKIGVAGKDQSRHPGMGGTAGASGGGFGGGGGGGW